MKRVKRFAIGTLSTAAILAAIYALAYIVKWISETPGWVGHAATLGLVSIIVGVFAAVFVD